MQFRIKNVADLGLVVRAERKRQKIRLDNLSSYANVGHVFTRHLEHGCATVQLGRVLRILDELGIYLYADFDDSTKDALSELREVGLRPLAERRRKAPSPHG